MAFYTKLDQENQKVNSKAPKKTLNLPMALLVC